MLDLAYDSFVLGVGLHSYQQLFYRALRPGHEGQ